MSGRFTLSGVPMSMPGKCGICGVTRDRTFLDTSLDFEFYGALIFCDTCVKEMGHEVGLIEPDAYTQLLARHEEAVAELIATKTRLKHTEAYIASVFSVDPVNGNLASEPVVSEPSDLPGESGEPDSEESSDSGEGDESETLEPAAKQGPDDVRNSDLPQFSATLEL